ncbi:MAG: class IV adenylate cyclase [Patescibacteria group bacterium]
MAKEFEIKFTSVNKDIIREKLASIGLSCVQEEFLIQRKTFHPIETSKNEFFRVRKEAKRTTMTYKCIHSSNIDGVEEHETEISDFNEASDILMKTGLRNTSTQENYREVWKNADIEVCIDTWPGLNPYIEIEGQDPEIVKNYTEKLGFNFDDGLFG